MRVSNSNFISRPARAGQSTAKPIMALHEFNNPSSSVLAEWDAELIRMKNSDLRAALRHSCAGMTQGGAGMTPSNTGVAEKNQRSSA